VSIEVQPATTARFGDVATMLGPKNPESSVCWCLSHRLDWKTNRALTEAISLYRAAGYREVPAFNDEAYAHHWFEKSL